MGDNRRDRTLPTASSKKIWATETCTDRCEKKRWENVVIVSPFKAGMRTPSPDELWIRGQTTLKTHDRCKVRESSRVDDRDERAKEPDELRASETADVGRWNPRYSSETQRGHMKNPANEAQ